MATTFRRQLPSLALPLLLLLLLTAQTKRSAAADVRVPPTIVRGPTKHWIFRPGDKISLECVATGMPTNIEYEWLHNGETLNLNLNHIRVVHDGTIEINDASAFNEGYYQCFARNQWGSARSNTSHLQRAVLRTQGGGSEQTVRPVMAEEGKPFTIEASPPNCFPKPSFDWETGKIIDNTPTRLQLGRRIQTDENGNLHFAYAIMADALTANMVYKCVVTNPYLDIKSGGSYTAVTVQQNANGIRPFSPQLLFKTASKKIVVEGQDVSLRCFFSGYPEPTIVWKRHGRQVQGGRFIIQNFESELIIKKVEQSDEGEYVCSATNSASRTSDQIIEVDVQAVPVFRHTNLLPRDINVTEGESVNLYCGAYAEPEADVVWMQNGKELDLNALPPKFRLSNGNRNLTIVNVCKNCGTEKSDLQVIQCNASNAHGYAFAAGYINVLLPTKVLNKEEDAKKVIGSKDEGHFVFHCHAASDDSTPVTVRWYKIDDSTGDADLVHNVSNKVVLGKDGSLTIKLASNDSEGWSVYGGVYECKASNGYSSDKRTVTIFVSDPAPLPGPTDTIVMASVLDLWWVFVAIAAFLLILIIIICCCVYCQRNKGDTYPVDEKERENGNNPEKELLDNGFQNYHRPSEDPIKGSQASLVDSWPKINHDGGDGDHSSLDEYGDPEVGKFAEDGSFVGAYATATNDRRNRGRTGSRGNY